jgi:hypothetical protein
MPPLLAVKDAPVPPFAKERGNAGIALARANIPDVFGSCKVGVPAAAWANNVADPLEDPGKIADTIPEIFPTESISRVFTRTLPVPLLDICRSIFVSVPLAESSGAKVAAAFSINR